MSNRFTTWLRRLWPVVGEEERAIRRELMFHIERLVEEFRAKGMSRRAARREALKKFGKVGHVEQAVAKADGIHEIMYRGDGTVKNILSDLGQDVRYGLRSLRKSPGFTMVAVLTLALGIGANTAIFSVVNGVLLQPLPYENPEQLVLLRQDADGRPGLASMSPPDLVDFREQSRLFESFEAIWINTISMGDEDEGMEQITYAWATRDFFEFLGTPVMYGRTFTAEEETPDGPPVVILSYELWQRRYGGDRKVLGSFMRLGDRPREVVGIMPPGFRVLMGKGTRARKHIDAWTPQNYWINRDSGWLRVIGRLKGGVTLPQAQQELDQISAYLRATYQSHAASDFRIRAEPLHADLVREVRPGILALFGAVGFVLLIACANVANLLMVRARIREREIVVRAALGAGPGRLLRQILTESVILSLIGGAAGLVVAYWGVQVLVYLRPANLPRLQDIAVDTTVASFALALSLVTGILFGLLPARSSMGRNLARALREGSRAATAGRAGRTQGVLAVAQVALSLLLLTGAGLLIQTYGRLLNVNMGFNPKGVLTATVPFSFRRYPTPESKFQFNQQVSERLAALPEVESVGWTRHIPLSGGFFTAGFAYDAETERRWGSLQADYLAADPGYFDALRIPVLSGRNFSRQDMEPDRRVVIVDSTLARQAWPGQEAVGQRLLINRRPGLDDRELVWADVIGVVPHTRRYDVRNDGRPQVYFRRSTSRIVIRTAGDPMALAGALKEIVGEVGSGRPVHNVRTLQSYVDDSLADSRFAVVLLGLLAGIALLLSAVGVYGTVAYSVAQRTREFGLRQALGADGWSILSLVMGRGLKYAAMGIVLGLVGSVGLTRYLQSLLFEVSATDTLTLTGVSLLLMLVCLVACYIPARRATKVDPMTALRYE